MTTGAAGAAGCGEGLTAAPELFHSGARESLGTLEAPAVVAALQRRQRRIERQLVRLGTRSRCTVSRWWVGAR